MGTCSWPIRFRKVSLLDLIAVAPVLMTFNSPAVARNETDGAKACLLINDGVSRLACFDREVRKFIEPRFQGRLNTITEPFQLSAPARLRYQSDGAIFVLYLKAAPDKVIQNLHLGGGGEDSFVIETPGTYFLQINGSEDWRIWLEPLETNQNQSK